MNEVRIAPARADRFDPLLGPERSRDFAEALNEARRRISGHTLWCVNSTEQGGGVAEMLSSILGYLVGAGISTRWVVIEGDEEFFNVTKRLHHLLHGEPGNGVPTGADPAVADLTMAGTMAHRSITHRTMADRTAADCTIYERCTDAAGRQLLDLISPGDPVILHDPQTLGLLPILANRGAPVVWSCHVGADRPNDFTRAAWDFLRTYLAEASAYVFSRPQYAWEGLDLDRTAVIPPCVDAFSPKNQVLDDATVAAILRTCGLIPGGPEGAATYVRQDGTLASVGRRAQIHQDRPLAPDARLVTQISRWDPLKDHLGVMRAFTEQVPASLPADLVLAGPDPDSVADDPEGLATFRELLACWSSLPPAARSRVHLACLPMEDAEENGAMVNALQRRSDVIVQKSLAEGFGLTVAEAMLKGRPTVGSRVGGIQDQIAHGWSGLLIDDPSDVVACGRAITLLLNDPDCAQRLGRGAVEHVLDNYLVPCHLTRYLRLLDRVWD